MSWAEIIPLSSRRKGGKKDRNQRVESEGSQVYPALDSCRRRTAIVLFAPLCPSVSFCLSFISLCFCTSPPLSLDRSGFVFLTTSLLLCQCDRRRREVVPVGSVDKTVDSALAGTVRVLAESPLLLHVCALVCRVCLCG